MWGCISNGNKHREHCASLQSPSQHSTDSSVPRFSIHPTAPVNCKVCHCSANHSACASKYPGTASTQNQNAARVHPSNVCRHRIRPKGILLAQANMQAQRRHKIIMLQDSIHPSSVCGHLSVYCLWASIRLTSVRQASVHHSAEVCHYLCCTNPCGKQPPAKMPQDLVVQMCRSRGMRSGACIAAVLSLVESPPKHSQICMIFCRSPPVLA